MRDMLKVEEILIFSILPLLQGIKHVAIGASSPIPAAAAMLMRKRSRGQVRVSILGSTERYSFTDGGRELFDLAGQGRIDAFFLSGGQIDGEANVNLIGIGDYPQMSVRFPGSFGSAYLYYVVPRVILFREEHTSRVFVDKVDFISAAGGSEPFVHRPGGPYALVTGRCVMKFNSAEKCFVLASLHPGESVQSVKENTGFEFICPDNIPETPLPGVDLLNCLRGSVADQLAATYPTFVDRVFG